MTFSVVKGTIDRVLDKNLQDLVRGIRNHKGDETKYINHCLDEIRSDLKQNSIAIKSNALAKLVYLQMLGCDISWAVFNIVEIISSQRFTFKRVGYLAAAQSFHYDMDVLMLTTNQIHKDLSRMNTYDSGVALSGLSCFVNQELAMNLYNDILSLTVSSKPYLRKKSVLLLYKLFLHHPEALRICFPRLKEKLEDPDTGVQCAAVNVICELARKNPRNYLSLAPIFFNMMKNSTNNWVLIKIIKLFGALTPLEPRLGKKLIEPLTNLIHSTSAMSLLYECINTIVAVLFSISSGVPDNHAAIQLCVQKLRVLIEDSDQNLKYLGLMAMGKILPHHAKSLQSHKDLVLACLHDKDESVRLRALSLLHGMVTKRSLVEVVQSIIGQINQISASNHYRNELVAKVIHICAQENYHYITSFEWYISVLVELARMDGVRDGGPLADQLIEVAIRVPSVRSFCVDQMAILVDLWPSLVSTGANQSALHRVVEAAAWICGEYAHHLSDARHTLTGMFSAANISSRLSDRIQAVLLLSAFKLYCSVARQWAQQSRDQQQSDRAGGDDGPGLAGLGERLLELTNHMVEQLTASMHSPDLEVQERAVSLHQLCSLVGKRLKKLQRMAADQAQSADTNQDAGAPSAVCLEGILCLIDEFTGLFVGEINRVAPKAQRKVPIPAGLDLDAWINPPSGKKVDALGDDMKLTSMLMPAPGVLLVSDNTLNVSPRRGTNMTAKSSTVDGIFPEMPSTATPMPSQSELDEMRVKRLQAQENNPHYLKPKSSSALLDGGDVGNSVQSESAAPVDESKMEDLPATPVGSTVREFAKPEQFVQQIRQQFLQLDIRENTTKLKTKKSTRTNRKSANRGGTVKKKEQKVSQATPAVLVLADYDRPEGASSGGAGDSSPERESVPELNRRLDLECNGASPSVHGKSPSRAKGKPVVDPDEHVEATDAQPLQRRRANQGSAGTGAPTTQPNPKSSGHRRQPGEKVAGGCTPPLVGNDTSLSRGVEAGLRSAPAERDNKAGHRKSKGAHHAQKRLGSQMVSDETPASLQAMSDSAFLPVPISPDQLVQQLMLQGQQSLSSKLSGKILWSGTDAAFLQLVSMLSANVPCTIVEWIGQQAASLYAVYGTSAVPVCCLLKHSSEGSVHYAIKSVTAEVAAACAGRVKALVSSPTPLADCPVPSLQ